MKQKLMNICRKLSNYKITALCVIMPLLITGCADDADQTSASAKEYFDIPVYFEQLAHDLNENDVGLRKTLSRPSDSEVVKKDDVDWLAELKPFIGITLTKPAFRYGYLIDTVAHEVLMTRVYTARDSSFDIKEVVLFLDQDVLTKLEAVHSKDNVYYYSREVLTFEHQRGYEINVSNVMKAGRPVEFSIRGEMTGGTVN